MDMLSQHKETRAESGASHLTLHRRDFLRGASAGLLLYFTVGFQSRGAEAANNVPDSGAPNIGAYFTVNADNTVTIHIGATEMGQGIMTGLAQLAAEELRVSWDNIQAVHAPAITSYAAGKSQSTGGSRSMRNWYTPMRQAAAVAREMLIATGTVALGKNAGECGAKNGYVYVLADDSKKVAYAAIVADAAKLTPPAPGSVSVGATSDIVGKSMPRKDIPAKVNGSAIFGIDVMVPNMVFATVVHCPTIGGTVATMPAKPAAAVAVVNLGNAVGLVANDTWTAQKLAAALKITWSIPATSASIDSAKMLAVAKPLLTSGTANVMEPQVGDPDTAYANAVAKIDATYQLPYVAHACMEVLNCTVAIPSLDGTMACEIWAPTQSQSKVVSTVATMLGVTASQIRLHTTFLGGGLGRKLDVDYVVQAVQIAQKVGKPVKLTWPRTQDFKNDHYRPSSLFRVQAGVSSTGAFSSLIFRNVSPSITVQNGGAASADKGAVAGALGLPYDIQNKRIEYVADPAKTPLGYWRSVGESYNIFAVESAVDELAVAAGKDPTAFRKLLLANSPGLQVVNEVVTLAGKTPLAASGARGIAFMSGFGSYIAMIVEISLDSSAKIRVNKVFSAIDCGTIVNPDSVEAQIQGGVAHGISATLWGEVKFTNGVAAPTNFSNYRVMRMSEMPAVSTVFVNSGGITPVGGVGETAVPVVAPAIANAYFKLKGIRQRTLPFYSGSTMGGL